jgi:hypothetical protein
MMPTNATARATKSKGTEPDPVHLPRQETERYQVGRQRHGPAPSRPWRDPPPSPSVVPADRKRHDERHREAREELHDGALTGGPRPPGQPADPPGGGTEKRHSQRYEAQTLQMRVAFAHVSHALLVGHSGHGPALHTLAR